MPIVSHEQMGPVRIVVQLWSENSDNNCEEKWAWASEKGKLFIYWIFIGTLSQLFNTLPPNFLVEASNLKFETKKS